MICLRGGGTCALGLPCGGTSPWDPSLAPWEMASLVTRHWGLHCASSHSCVACRVGYWLRRIGLGRALAPALRAGSVHEL